MKKYIAPNFRVVDMTADDNLMVTESFTDDVADVKEFKDDDLWANEPTVTTEGSKNLWDKEW
jgi:hypothetical protein